MAARLPRRPTLGHVSLSTLTPQTTTSSSQTTRICPSTQFQTRNSTIVQRPRRPYMFTQIVQLSDGSTYTCRTTSPLAMYKSTKDTRNHILWNPSSKSLKNIEVDEAGKLAAFRSRFGRSWDAKTPASGDKEAKTADDFEAMLTKYAVHLSGPKPYVPPPKKN